MGYGVGNCDKNRSLIHKPVGKVEKTVRCCTFCSEIALFYFNFLKDLVHILLGWPRFRPENCKKITPCPSRAA